MRTKKSRKKDEIEGGVKKVYQKVNPSIHKIEDKDVYVNLENKYKMLLQDKLKLPIKFFNNSSLLDFGSGTGERIVFFRRWGAETTSVEFNEDAIKRANKLMNKYGVPSKGKYYHSCFFDFETDEKFDFVTAYGVIHHTHSSEKALKHMVKFMKPGGFLIVGSANIGGFFQRSLQRHIVRLASSLFGKEIHEVAKILFNEHIQRASKMAMRSEKAVIYDTYINPRYNACSLSDLYGWITESNLQIYSTWPPSCPFPLLDSTWEEPIRLESVGFDSLLLISELGLMSLKDNDVERLHLVAEKLKPYAKNFKLLSRPINDVHELIDVKILNNCSNAAENIYNNINDINMHFSLGYFDSIKGFLKEFISLCSFLEKGDFDLNSLKEKINENSYIFKGVQGNPQTYLVATDPLY